MPRYDDHVPERTESDYQREESARLGQLDPNQDGTAERREKVYKPGIICLDETPHLDDNGNLVREHMTPTDLAVLLEMDVQELLGMFVTAKVRQLRIKGLLFEISHYGFADYLKQIGRFTTKAMDYENRELRDEIARKKDQP